MRVQGLHVRRHEETHPQGVNPSIAEIYQVINVITASFRIVSIVDTFSNGVLRANVAANNRNLDIVYFGPARTALWIILLRSRFVVPR